MDTSQNNQSIKTNDWTKVKLILTLNLFDDLHNEHKDQSSHQWSSDSAAAMRCANKFLLQILINLFQLAYFILNPANFEGIL